MQNNILIKANDKDTTQVDENRYSPKYIVKLLTERFPYGKVSFYFRDKNDYIALYSNGRINVRDGEKDMFRAWVDSEFRNLKPQSVFQELERELIRIDFTPVSSRENYSFNSYSDFIIWLTDRN